MSLRFKCFGQAVAAVVLFSALAVVAPIVNADARPPRSVFVVLPDGSQQPVVSLSARRLPSGKWRMAVHVSNFRFTDLCVVTADTVAVGHAHVLVDGVKVASAYQPFVDLDLPLGSHRVAAVLRAQDHRALVGRTGLLKAEIRVAVIDDVPAPAPVLRDHGMSERGWAASEPSAS